MYCFIGKFPTVSFTEYLLLSHYFSLPLSNRSDLPIAHVKRGLRGVLLNDMKMLKDAIFDLDNVFTVSTLSILAFSTLLHFAPIVSNSCIELKDNTFAYLFCCAYLFCMAHSATFTVQLISSYSTT